MDGDVAKPGPAAETLRLAGAIVGRREQAIVASGFLLLLLACAAAATMTFRARDAEDLVSHTLEVRQNIQQVTGLLTDAESAQRGYLLTGDETYLAPLNRARPQLPIAQKRLQVLTSDNSAQQTRLRSAEKIIADRMAIIERTVELRRSGRGAEALALVKSGAGLKLSAQVRGLLSDADFEEARLFRDRVSAAGMQRTRLLTVMLVSALIATILMMAVTIVGRRYTRAVIAANVELRHEISERERIQAQLRQSQKMEAIGRLTGGVAHDFNNMLAIVIGSLDLALTRTGDEARTRKLMESALEGARRGAALTQRLLAFSRQAPLDPKPVDVNKSVSDMSQLLFRTLGEEIEIETVLAAGLWRANLDAPQLESAILNLAVNARDAMVGGGKLTLETANTYLDQTYAEAHDEIAAGQYVLIAVSDTGAGMTPEVMANAFEPFFTTKPAGSGTGLGLSQVHGFAKQSGGHVKLYSEPGHGTTVKLYFPRLKSNAAIAEIAASPPLARDNAARTILVVEDEAGVRAFAVEALRELGYQVLEAEGARGALALLANHPEIDLLLTDVVMPETNGRRLAEQVLRERPNLPVIYMTGYTRNAIVHNGMLDPGTHLLTKPFTLTQLDAELRAVLPPPAPPDVA
jgi:signal transduction histidine kinase